MRVRISHEGFSLIEVMVAMMIVGFALVGTMGAVQLSAHHVRQGGLSGKALEMVQTRLEVKRSVLWSALLEDDLDSDGIPETLMKDDGQGLDSAANDGIYTAMQERDGITVMWTIQSDDQGPINSAGLVTITARASYPSQKGQNKEVQIATKRANPTYVGQR